VAGDEAGDILSSTNPTSGTAAWQAAAVGQGGIGVISCAGITACVAGNGTGQLLSSSSPNAGPLSWAVTGSDPGHWMAGLTCTAGSGSSGGSLCVATDSAGDVLTTSNPAATTPMWTTADVNGTNVIWDVSCPVTTLCVAGDVTGSILSALQARPVVTKISPNSGPSSGGTAITITGTGFVTGATVEIGQGSGAGPTATPATNVKVVSPTEITAVTGGGAKAGTWNLLVITPGGTSVGNSGDYYTYN
jgi:hypothetical protein